ncbi:MAG: RNA-binding domain-containing protein [Oligoflexus sp.]
MGTLQLSGHLIAFGKTLGVFMDLQSFLERDEGTDIEFKKAADSLPSSIWETYSAMANTTGGYIILGVSESKGRTNFTGITNIPAIKKVFWDTINNPQKISKCILTDNDLFEIHDQGKTALVIRVPTASRTQKPIYLKNNPLLYTYKRNHEGDYKCDELTVKMMLADATYDTRDSNVLKNTSISDIDLDTLKSYRISFTNVKPSHPWQDLSDEDFLFRIQALRKDRESGLEGLSVAGLLMFGNYLAIKDFFPGLHLDYRELDPQKNERWVDRVYIDGSWSGNLYQFYRRVYPKLVDNLKIPFQTKAESRVSDTDVHMAIREALTNALIHADYFQDANIIILKSSSHFDFKNSGLLRIPLEQAYIGGESDCRNKILQTMFDLVGLGEKAGSGISKILNSWNQQHWKAPLIKEDHERNTTKLVLPMLSLVPQKAIESLKGLFGKKFDGLDHIDRIILATTFDEKNITHFRLQKVLPELHPSDISRKLKSLIEHGFLKASGNTRGKSYFLNSDGSSIDNGLSSIDNGPSSIDNGPSSIDNGQAGQKLPEDINRLLIEIVEKNLSSKKRVHPDEAKETIKELLKVSALSLQQISKLLSRSKNYVFNYYLKPLLEEGAIEQIHPNRNDPRQMYIANRNRV